MKKAIANILISDTQKKILEKFGVLLESKGWQPAVARVFSLLLITDSPSVTFDEIREALNLSKSATSSAINVLLTTDRIEYITKTGDRKRYFRSKIITLNQMVTEEHRRRCELTEVLEQIYEEKSNTNNSFCESMRDALDYLHMMNEEFPKLYENWEKNKNK